jgi:MYXO-CTERM domain-containing protein
MLPFTGASTVPLLVAGLALLGLGAATLLRTVRRGRT